MECFNSPYGTSYFPEYAETIPGTTTNALSAVAKECNIFLIGGSLPERDGDKLYNTCPVFDPSGNLMAKHRKIHLFDVDVPGKIRFQESEALSPGNSLTTIDTDWCKVGIGICYDVSFPELAQLYAKKGCKLLCYPAAYNMTTGPAHWELQHAGRALDNQLYVAAVSPARDETALYVAWGHSMTIDPWGKIIGKCDHKEDIVLVDIDPDYVDTVRSQIPAQLQKRHDIYEVTENFSYCKFKNFGHSKRSNYSTLHLLIHFDRGTQFRSETLMMKSFRMAMVQLAVGKDKAKNIQHACQMVRNATQKGANMVVLPECFNSPYGTSYFPEYAETIPGTTTNALSAVAKECNIFLIGGSLPERDGDKLYNTCPVFNRSGNLVAKHRKMHLFDIHVPGKIRFQESETLSAGNSLTTVDTDWCKVGIGVCYDIRFPELAQLYAKKGCKLVCYPSASNMITGPVHWDLLYTGRALDNQLYVAAVSPARDESASYVAWGHSMAIDPWGKVIGKCDHKEDMILVDIDPDYVDIVRSHVPSQLQKRHDIYEVTEK